MELLSLSNLERQKGEFKGQIVSKFDLDLLNAYKSMYFDRNISEKGSYLSCVTNCEFHFSYSKRNRNSKKRSSKSHHKVFEQSFQVNKV